ncbi:Multidrug resistance protein MdtA [Cupriavidus yeoncheonensis]|uniref:Multidrug resistance protein MdtA n=1 Tax=Cupriavidus yeoncheonensis TaxID=1462994 RepID=A0A916IRD3_9BURK|nr:efflux RND transporter periplasmic adaptor subunit [Cupriavidus yeoncheonensis]CAG2138827.1 Multidrug resistance protein MdtA [Cupriavidus yeoncheonensis]
MTLPTLPDSADDTLPETARPARRVRGRARPVLAGAGILACALAAGIVPRLNANAALSQRTAQAMVPAVSVVRPARASAAREIVLPGDVRAYQDAAVYARVNGYLRRWVADIGTPVRQGQLLAEIDAPEVADQLRQARAEEATAAANYALAKTTADRWKDLQASNSVAQQETDQKIADMQAKAAALASARSNTSRLAQMASYTQIRAPFDGVVTARNVDTGALIDAGSSPGQGRELFHLSAGHTLRVYVQVPQDASAMVGPDLQAWLTLPQAPGQRFPARVARNAGAIDPVTRSLRVELDVDSQGGRILPGAYAEVHLSSAAGAAGFDLPASTLAFRPEGPCVAVVGQDGQVAIRKVVLGRDFGSHVQVLDGLQGAEQVVVNPGDGLTAGARVRVVAARPGTDRSS